MEQFSRLNILSGKIFLFLLNKDFFFHDISNKLLIHFYVVHHIIIRLYREKIAANFIIV